MSAVDVLSPPAALHFLDAPQEWAAFSKPMVGNAGWWESSILIEGMHCAACALTVEDALQRMPGVRSAQVGAASHRAKVVWSDNQVLPSAWFAAVKAAGYRALPANDVHATERRKLETRQALWRWLVAGLCMMQVMMYAYPAYIAKSGDLSQEMEHLLRWASWVLSLPVILFSCGPFFKGAWRDLTHARISMDLPVALGIAITFAVSTAGTFEPDGIFGKEVFFDSLTMFVFFLLTGRWLELRLRDRTAGALEALMNRLPDTIERQTRQGAFERVVVRRVVVGDIVRVHAGEYFPADGVITHGETAVDEALMTGESHPVARATGAGVLCGSRNVRNTVIVRVEQVGTQTRFAQIVALMDSASGSKPRIARLADRWAKPFLVAVLLSAVGACVWWWGRDPAHALMVAVAVLIVTCPCALSLATPAAMLASAGAMAKAGVLVRHLQALEALASVTTVVFDKTGTLTSDRLTLQCTQTRPGLSPDTALQMASALASHSFHPVSQSLVAAAAQRHQGAAVVWTCSDALETVGGGMQGLVSAPAQMQVGTAPVRLRLGSEIFCDLPESNLKGSHVFLADASGLLASFALEETLRAHAAAAVGNIRELGLAVAMWSGDSSAACEQVAQRCGILSVAGNCSPEAKLDRLKALQAQGESVVMVGDGLNDGPVLAGANVSIAFGNAVPLARSQADAIILGNDLLLIPSTIVQARKTLAVVRQNLAWAVAYNAACVPLAVAGLLPAWLAGLGMAASSLMVVLNALSLARPQQSHQSALYFKEKAA